MRAIELYIKYEKSPADVIRELGYPDRKSRASGIRCTLKNRKPEYPVKKGMRRSLASRRKNKRRQSAITSSIDAIFQEPSGPWDIPTGRHSGCGAKNLCPICAGNAVTA